MHAGNTVLNYTDMMTDIAGGGEVYFSYIKTDIKRVVVIWRSPVKNNAFPSACSDIVEKEVNREADRGQNVSPVPGMPHTEEQETSQHHTSDRHVPTLAQV